MAKTSNSAKIQNLLQGALTVRELIEQLEGYADDALVVFADDYGDYGHTTQALPVRLVEELDEYSERLETTAYSASEVSIATKEDEEDEEGEEVAQDDEFVDVIILRT